MAAHTAHSQSYRAIRSTSPQSRVRDSVPALTTPVHSPHHSVASSMSARTTVHTLTIHEYRKQQNTPVLRAKDSSAKTLRRKAAEPTLNGVERSTSLGHTPKPHRDTSLSRLYASQSAEPLRLSDSFPPNYMSLTDDLRSHSAGPRVQSGSLSSVSTLHLSGKARHFNSRKRLPKPSTLDNTALVPPPLVPVKVTAAQYSRYYTGDSPIRHTFSSGTHTTPTISSFSLSHFPQPPQPDPSAFLTPPHDRLSTRLDTRNLASSAPATPPITPATVRYRGASFDLVNPHESLLLHDIITPSREFESSEFLPIQSSDSSFALESEMALKRPLYGDLSSAHEGIMRRAGGPFGNPSLELPLPPTPAAVSPNSSSYTSPPYSPESDMLPSPLAINTTSNNSRFTLKGLTRSLTRKLAKTAEPPRMEELQVLRSPDESTATLSTIQDALSLVKEPSITPPEASYHPLSPTSPVTPTSPISPFESDENALDDTEIGNGREQFDDEPLTSMFPDDVSLELGRNDAYDRVFSEPSMSRPYYDDLESIYPSSSIYTTDDHRLSNYQQSLRNVNQSDSHLRLYGFDARGSHYDYDHGRLSGSVALPRASLRASHMLTSTPEWYPVNQEDGKTDTISKLIEQYSPTAEAPEMVRTMGSGDLDNNPDSCDLIAASFTEPPQAMRAASGFSQFEFDLHVPVPPASEYDGMLGARQDAPRKLEITRAPGSPPHHPAPLAPPFSSSEESLLALPPHLSGYLSNESSDSYGDTRHLLQIPVQNGGSASNPTMQLQPSSSYSQTEAPNIGPSSSYSQIEEQPSPRTPQAALDQADQIFKDAVEEHKTRTGGIPAMWARRSSGSQLLKRKPSSQQLDDGTKRISTAAASARTTDDRTDWETIGDQDQLERQSIDSIADYSSSEGSRNSLEIPAQGYSSGRPLPEHQIPSFYNHPSPLPTHKHPFSSSPPRFSAGPSVHTAPDISSPPLAACPLPFDTMPVLRQLEHAVPGSLGSEPRALTPWAIPYALSDKETQELLASGPNDDIIFDQDFFSSGNHKIFANPGSEDLLSSTPQSPFDDPPILERENTFEKLISIGPKGNLTGTPQGTGMHETGSSVADNSSPGYPFASDMSPSSLRSDRTGFYASSPLATKSVSVIPVSREPVDPVYERPASQVTLFPSVQHADGNVSQGGSTARRQSLRFSRMSLRAERRTSRAAVPGQTKLREMILAPTTRTTLSSQDTRFSRFINDERPSTTETNSPLRPRALSVKTLPIRTVLTHEYSPHLLCPERACKPEDEIRRRRLSWLIFAAFCLLPPCLILFRFWGDSIIVSVTEGKLGHCTPRSKRVALVAGIAVNVTVVAGILVPILVAHALKAI